MARSLTVILFQSTTHCHYRVYTKFLLTYTAMYRRNHKVLPLGITALQPQSHFHLGTPYTYIHTYTHTYIHIHIHTYIHRYIHTYIRTYIHTYVYTYIHTYNVICFFRSQTIGPKTTNEAPTEKGGFPGYVHMAEEVWSPDIINYDGCCG